MVLHHGSALKLTGGGFLVQVQANSPSPAKPLKRAAHPVLGRGPRLAGWQVVCWMQGALQLVACGAVTAETGTRICKVMQRLMLTAATTGLYNRRPDRAGLCFPSRTPCISKASCKVCLDAREPQGALLLAARPLPELVQQASCGCLGLLRCLPPRLRVDQRLAHFSYPGL